MVFRAISIDTSWKRSRFSFYIVWRQLVESGDDQTEDSPYICTLYGGEKHPLGLAQDAQAIPPPDFWAVHISQEFPE